MVSAALSVALAAALASAAEPPPSPPASDAPGGTPAAAASPAPPASPEAPAEKAPAAPAAAPLPRGAVLEEVSGTVREIDRQAYRVQVDTASGPVTISLDRNTMVYTGSGLATVLDVRPGTQIRAGRNADFLAYWVQVRTPTKAEPSSTPVQGTGPAGGGGAATPAGDAAGAGGVAPPSGAAGGGAGTTVPSR